MSLCFAAASMFQFKVAQVLLFGKDSNGLYFLSFSQQCWQNSVFHSRVYPHQHGSRNVWREFLWYSPLNQGSATEHESEAERAHYQQQFCGRDYGHTLYGYLLCVKVCCWRVEWILGSKSTTVWHQVSLTWHMLLTQFEVRTVSYGPGLPPRFIAQARSTRAMNRRGKKRVSVPRRRG